MIIDSHVHTPALGDSADSALCHQQTRDHGVGMMLVSALGRWDPFPDEQAIREANDQAREFVATSPVPSRWLVYLNPQLDNWQDEFDRALANDAVGVKLWISLKDPQGRVDRTADVIAHAARHGVPTLIHTFNRIDGQLEGELNTAEFADLAVAHPNARMVAAHAGGNWWHALGHLRNRAPNAAVDISGCYPQRGMVEALINDLGADRVLFGTDTIKGGKPGGRSVPSQLAKVLFADVPPDVKEMVLWRNAARIFQLNDLPASPPETSAPPAPEESTFREDHFCFCGSWPLFLAPAMTPSELDSLLAANDIDRAFTGDLGSVYRMDLEAANSAFCDACVGCSRVAPLAIIDPAAPNWRCVLSNRPSGCAGVLLLPYLHNYALDERFDNVLRACADESLPIWMNIQFGDHRLRHAGLAGRPVPLEEILRMVRTAPRNRYVLQGVNHVSIMKLLDEPRVNMFRFDISRLTDSAGAFKKAHTLTTPDRWVLGSEFPLRDIREVRYTAQMVL